MPLDSVDLGRLLGPQAAANGVLTGIGELAIHQWKPSRLKSLERDYAKGTAPRTPESRIVKAAAPPKDPFFLYQTEVFRHEFSNKLGVAGGLAVLTEDDGPKFLTGTRFAVAMTKFDLNGRRTSVAPKPRYGGYMYNVTKSKKRGWIASTTQGYVLALDGKPPEYRRPKVANVKYIALSSDDEYLYTSAVEGSGLTVRKLADLIRDADSEERELLKQPDITALYSVPGSQDVLVESWGKLMRVAPDGEMVWEVACRTPFVEFIDGDTVTIHEGREKLRREKKQKPLFRVTRDLATGEERSRESLTTYKPRHYSPKRTFVAVTEPLGYVAIYRVADKKLLRRCKIGKRANDKITPKRFAWTEDERYLAINYTDEWSGTFAGIVVFEVE